MSKKRKISENLHIVEESPLISATQTRNYAIHDPLCDYLDLYYDKGKAEQSPTTNFLMSCGVEFEKNVIEEIESRFYVAKCPRFYSKENVEKTIEFMKLGANIIYSPSVFNSNNNTYGIPDLLVRADFLNTLFKTKMLGKKHEKKKSSKLRLPYSYVVVDIKFSTLPLCSNGKYIQNVDNFLAYKTQLCVYNFALGNMQGYLPRFAFILGRRFIFTKRKETTISNTSLERAGVIDFSNFDYPVIEKTKEAIVWRKRLATYGKDWILNLKTMKKIPELFPNMKVDNEKWRSVKKELAKKFFEFTSIWNIGLTEREKLWDKNIYSWNSTFDVKLLNVNEERRRCIEHIIKVNKDSHRVYKYYPTLIKNIPYSWDLPPDNATELFIDFETISDCYNTNVDQYCGTITYLIGVSHLNKWGDLEYTSFSCMALNEIEEKKMLTKFAVFLRSFSQSVCYYWVADKHFLDALLKKYNLSLVGINTEWRDLSKVLIFNSLAIYGCFNYKLKSIVKALNEMSIIPISYENFDSGFSSMIQAISVYRSNFLPNLRELLSYNKTDCEALYYILEWLRTIVE